MNTQKQSESIHLMGDKKTTESEPLAVETLAGRVHVEWTPRLKTVGLQEQSLGGKGLEGSVLVGNP